MNGPSPPWKRLPDVGCLSATGGRLHEREERTHGLLPVDGPFGDFSDDEGFRAQARRSATLGMVGKWAIHPKQVALANEVFTPSEQAVAEAREILAAMESAKARGEGATVYKGRLVDIASIKQAEVIVRQAELIAG